MNSNYDDMRNANKAFELIKNGTFSENIDVDALKHNALCRYIFDILNQKGYIHW